MAGTTDNARKDVRERGAEAAIVVEVERRVPVAARRAAIPLIIDPRPAAHSINQPRFVETLHATSLYDA